MLKIANLLKNLLILVYIALKNKRVNGSRSSKTNKNLFKSQKLKNIIILSNAKIISFSTFKTYIIFTLLGQIFIQAYIFWHFNLKYYIKTETNALCHTIDRVLN